MSRILVTGSEGFVGRAVRALLRERSCEMIGVGQPGSAAEIGLDLGDPSFDAEALARRVGPVDGIIHLAARISRSSSIDAEARRNLAAIATSAVGLFEAFHDLHGPTHLVFCSSIKVYGPSTEPLSPLASPVRPESYSYGSAKLLGERMLGLAAARLGSSVAVVRPSFIYGPGQHSGNAIPIFLSACWRGERPRLFGPGRELRDDVFVGDVAYCMVEACLRRATGVFNATGECSRTLLQVAELCCEAVASAGGPRVEPLADLEKKAKPWIDQRFDLGRTAKLLDYVPTPMRAALALEAEALRPHTPSGGAST